MIELNIKDGETPLQYQKRLIYGKLVDKTLSDIDYSELGEFVYGQKYASDVVRRMMYGSRKTLELMESEPAANHPMDDIEQRLFELKKERQKFFDQRTAFNKVVRERARAEELNEIIVDAINAGSLPKLEYIPNDIVDTEYGNDLLVSLNDIHYGIDINNAWNVYNPDVCRQMLLNYINQIKEIAERHHSENCILFCNGDMISGLIHKTVQLANKENVIRQIMGVSEILSGFIAVLSYHFNTVKFVSVAGNHSRLDTKENSPKDERLDDLVEWYLKARLQSFKNVEIGAADKIDNTMYLINIRGKNYLGVHGDYENSEGKIAALRTMAGKDIYCILSGHMHHNKVDMVQGIKTVMAGSFVGMDDYCIEKRIYGRPEQIVCVCDKTGIKCHYDIPLSSEVNDYGQSN